MAGSVKRVTMAIVGAVVLLVGLALLVLPGPGLLLVLAGLLVLAAEFPALERYVDPVRDRAMKTAEESVSSPWRIVATVLGGAVLVGLGVLWGVRDDLPLGGWSTGSSLILSGVVIWGLVVWSYLRVRANRGA
ncbi:hypothetical protein GCM10010492_70700 [Saccharothrix mutabilis subsp. mutabilis]|uniref:Transmembrane protein (PGPGW) n=2 Tax=Saccharothrix mutabilis TaxID=33921 RepID=A0ABN0URY6_9PSEU